eukprot:4160747-Amphidinium_carterae.2
MANVEPAEHYAWMLTAGISFVNDMLLAPLITVMAPPILGALLIGILACWHRQPRSHIATELLGAASQPSNQAEKSRAEASSAQDKGDVNAEAMQLGPPASDGHVPSDADGDDDMNEPHIHVVLQMQSEREELAAGENNLGSLDALNGHGDVGSEATNVWWL